MKNFCSLSCRNRRKHSPKTKKLLSIAAINNQSHKNFDNNNPSLKNMGRKYSRIYVNICKVCNKQFIVSSKKKDRKCCSKECFEKQNGGYRENSVKGKGKYVNDSFGKKVFLQSSYEVKCSELLNKLNIRWIRPSYLTYITDNNKKSRYYPDFYLIDLNIYLDPKNQFLIDQDKEKIDIVTKQNNVIILIVEKKHLDNEDLFKSLLSIY